MKELLTTLASGDNFSKVLMVILLLVSGGNFFRIGNQGDETRQEVDRLHAITSAQVKAVYDYQKNYIDLIRGIRADHTKLMQHFGLGDSAIKEPPPMPELPPETYFYPPTKSK